MKLDLDTFPIRADCPATSQWWLSLYRALGDAIGVPTDAEPMCGGGYCSNRDDWQSEGRTWRGGLRVLGTKRNAHSEVVQVGYALFDDVGVPFAWSMDLDAVHRGSTTSIYWTDAQHRVVALTPAMKDALKRLKALTPKAPPVTAPFTAETQLMSVVVAPDGSRCYAADYTGMLHAWEVPSGRALFRVRVGAARQWLHPIAISPDGALVAAGRRKVAVVDTKTGALRCTIAGPRKAETQGIAFSPDGTRVALAAGLNVKGVDNGVSVWDASSGAQTFALRFDTMAASVAWTPDGAALIVGTQGPGGLRRVDLASAHLTQRVSSEDWMFDAVTAVEGGWCSVQWSGELIVCDGATLAEVARFKPEVRISARAWLAAARNAHEVMVGSVAGREVGLVDVRNGCCVRALPVEDFEGDLMGVSYGGGYAVAATGCRVSVWPLGADA